jgi:uncharacterized protein YdhG (YjbR/CyaY superfamily)
MRNIDGHDDSVMATKFATVDAYVAALPDGVQQVFSALRETVLRLAPGAEEAVKYDMPTWRVRGTYVIYAAAWKSHIGLYPVSRGDADFEAAVGPYRDKKDTVKFVYSKPMPFDIIERIVLVRLAELETRP